jgi:hypothetical protein
MNWIEKEGFAMDQSEIDQEYATFMIPKEQIPFYDNVESFARRFRKFTLLREVYTVYSDNSITQSMLRLKQNG